MSSKRYGSREEWAGYVCQRQQTRDPAKLEEAKRQGQLRSRARSHYKKACSIQTSSALSSHAYASGMRRTAASTRPEEWQEAAETCSRQMLQVRSVQRSMEDAMEDYEDDDCGDEAYAAAGELVTSVANELGLVAAQDPVPPETGLAAAVSGFGMSRVAASTMAVDINEMGALLSRLKVEPTDDEQRGALFKMYEANLETVEANREQLMAFWVEAGPDFSDHPLVKAAIEADLRKIDSPENMGIQFIDGQWFVYAMAKKATRNNGVIDGVLRTIRTKLELLGSQEECPICLDGFGDATCVTLGCAHIVCEECWEHWKEAQMAQGQQPFCPLCKNEDFLSAIVGIRR